MKSGIGAVVLPGVRPVPFTFAVVVNVSADDDNLICTKLLNGHEFEQALGVGDGQGDLACCSPWGRKEADTTERLN